MADIITPRTLSGFMELLPKDQVIFDKIRAVLEKTYSSYGFFPLWIHQFWKILRFFWLRLVEKQRSRSIVLIRAIEIFL